jgi:hypothetical protein
MLRMAAGLFLGCVGFFAVEIHGVFPGKEWEPVSKPAQGTGGQYITVLPSLGMVIAHKVNLATATLKDYVSPEDYMTMLAMLLSAQCQDSCK